MSKDEVVAKHKEACSKYGAQPVIQAYGFTVVSILLLLMTAASLSRNNILEKVQERDLAPISKEDAVLAGYAKWIQTGDDIELRWKTDISGQTIRLAETDRALETARADIAVRDKMVDALRDKIQNQDDELEYIRNSLRKAHIALDDKEREILDLRRAITTAAPMITVPTEDEALEATPADVTPDNVPAAEEVSEEDSSWLRRLFGK